MKKVLLSIILVGLLIIPIAAQHYLRRAPIRPRAIVKVASPQTQALINAALEQTQYTRYYDASYVQITYPGGDVPSDRGVCSDVIVRAFRKIGLDLQKEVHEDMAKNFSAYPKLWGLKKPDANIDHRRVANLMTYFSRQSKAVTITNDGKDYQPGDIVAWRFDNGLLHIGMVSNLLTDSGQNYYIVHNVGAGTRVEDALFTWKIIGHYRYFNEERRTKE